MSELSNEERQKIFEEEKARMEAQQALKGDANTFLIGHIVALLGGLFIVLGTFMPWAKLGRLSASGFDKAPTDSLILVGLGGIIAVLALVAITTKKSYALVVSILSLVSLALLVWLYFQLDDQLPAAVKIGAGFWLCCAGAIVVLVGRGIMGKDQKKEKAPAK